MITGKKHNVNKAASEIQKIKNMGNITSKDMEVPDTRLNIALMITKRQNGERERKGVRESQTMNMLVSLPAVNGDMTTLAEECSKEQRERCESFVGSWREYRFG